MRRYSVLLLVVLGIIIIAAGIVDLLNEAGMFNVELHIFGPLLIIAVGLWMLACVFECKLQYDDKP